MRHNRGSTQLRISQTVTVAAMVGFLWFVWMVAVAPADIIDATCRVKKQTSQGRSGIGTGCVFHVQGGNAYVLTNYHVAGQVGGQVQVTFWRSGYRSVPATGRVVWAAYTRGAPRDISVVEVSLAQLGGWAPAPVPLATEDIRPGDPIVSTGCSKGNWPSTWRGHVKSIRQGTLHFSPPPAGGRSGSAIFSADGQTIVGLLAWRTDSSDSEREDSGASGIAMLVSEVRAAAAGRASPHQLSPRARIDWGPGAEKGLSEPTVPLLWSIRPTPCSVLTGSPVIRETPSTGPYFGPPLGNISGRHPAVPTAPS